jgi:hypothetical protein
MWRQLHVAPLRAKLVGEVSLAAQVPWNPIEALAPGQAAQAERQARACQQRLS